MIVTARVARSGWFDFATGRQHRSDSELASMCRGLHGTPVLAEHPTGGLVRLDRDDVIGRVEKAWIQKGEPSWIVAELDLFHSGMSVARERPECSIGYSGHSVGAEQRGVKIDHIALAKAGDCRAGRECRIDAADLRVDGESWTGWRQDAVEMDSDSVADEVNSQLAEDYKPGDRRWVLSTSWTGPQRVPLAQIDFSGKKGWAAAQEGDDEERVEKFVKRIKQGWGKSIILIKHPGADKLFCVDGHHRLLAYKNLDQDALAYVGTVGTDDVSWVGFHDKQKKKDSASINTRRFDFDGGVSSLAAPVRTVNGFVFEGVAARVHLTQADGLRYPTGVETRDLKQTQVLARALVGVPVVLDHGGEVLGKVLSTRVLDGKVIATYSIKRPDAKDIVREVPELSAGYTCDVTDDNQQLIAGAFELALVTRGRCSSDQIACATRADAHACGCESKSACECEKKIDMKLTKKQKGILGKYTPPPAQGTAKASPPTTPAGPPAAPDPNERPQPFVQANDSARDTTMKKRADSLIRTDTDNEMDALSDRSRNQFEQPSEFEKRRAARIDARERNEAVMERTRGRAARRGDATVDPNDLASRSARGENSADPKKRGINNAGPWTTPEDCTCPHFPDADEEHAKECPLFVDPSGGLRDVPPTHYAQKTNEAAASRAGRRRGDEDVSDSIDSDDTDEELVAARALARSSDAFRVRWVKP